MNSRHLHTTGALLLVLAAGGLMWIGQPDANRKWQFMAPMLQPRLEQREVYIDAAELVRLMHNNYIDLRLIDVRDERQWNLFHLWGARHIPEEEISGHLETFKALPDNGVIILVGQDEAAPTRAWQYLMVMATQPNAYILAEGIDGWLTRYTTDPPQETATDSRSPSSQPRWAMGSRHPAAFPALPAHDEAGEHNKVKLQKKIVKKGGCG